MQTREQRKRKEGEKEESRVRHHVWCIEGSGAREKKKKKKKKKKKTKTMKACTGSGIIMSWVQRRRGRSRC